MKTTILKLRLFDRLTIPVMLPREGKYETGIVCKDIRKKLALSQAEIKEVKLESLPNGKDGFDLKWDPKKDRGKEFAFTELELFMVRANLKKLNDEEKLPTDPRWLDLYDRIMNSDGEGGKRKGKA